MSKQYLVDRVYNLIVDDYIKNKAPYQFFVNPIINSIDPRFTCFVITENNQYKFFVTLKGELFSIEDALSPIDMNFKLFEDAQSLYYYVSQILEKDLEKILFDNV